MKASELMTGDLVYSLSHRGEWFYPTKVKNIYHEDEVEPCGVIMEQYGCIIRSYEFKPIPLTEEILKVNGFEKGGMGTWWHESEFYLTSLNGYYFPFRLERMHINYVHQLQHALRLCGLNELADNFKIE